MLRICSLFVLAVVLALGPVEASDRLVGPARVVDGDTLVVAGTRVRLHGMDAPERGQGCTDAAGQAWECGHWASAMLQDLVQGHSLECTVHYPDRYGRQVATCHVAGTDIGAEMVRRGAAVAYRRYSMAYVAQEEAARASRRGLWQGAVQGPEQYRAQARTVQSSPGDCAIKGNISANGRIYHLPGQRYYDVTTIDTSRGQRWFCSEEEAQAAGWRRARH